MEMPVPDQIALSKKAGVVASLEASLPPGSVIHDPFETKAYECDAFTAYACPPMAVALPSSTAEVQAVLKTCRSAGVPVVPRAAGTSLAGGALPTADCVVLSTARMTAVLETDCEIASFACRPGSRIRPSLQLSKRRGFSMPLIRRVSWPAPSPATSP